MRSRARIRVPPARSPSTTCTRSLEEARLYFLSNRRRRDDRRCASASSGTPSRALGPVQGTVRPLDSFEQAGGGRQSTSRFDPYGSLFVVFRDRRGRGATGRQQFRKRSSRRNLSQALGRRVRSRSRRAGSCRSARLIGWTAWRPRSPVYSRTAVSNDVRPAREAITAGDRWLPRPGRRAAGRVRLDDKAAFGVV